MLVLLISSLLLLPVNTLYLTASLANEITQKSLVIHEFYGCVRKMPHVSLWNEYKEQFECIQIHFSKCVLGKTTPNSRRFEPSLKSYVSCGALLMTDTIFQLAKLNIFLDVIRDHHINMDVLEFNFWSSKHSICHNHGMVLVYKPQTRDEYCGKRLPWTLLVPVHEAYLQITVMDHRTYSLMIFYSGIHINWISDIAQVDSVFLKVKMLAMIPLQNQYSEINIISFKYYIMSNQNENVHIDAIFHAAFKGELVIYDGPGILANVLLNISNTSSAKTEIIVTSSFSSFIFVSGHELDEDVTLNTRSKIVTQSAGCRTTTSLNVTSSNLKNVVCVAKYRVSTGYVAMNVSSLTFDGPDTLMGDRYRCDYGGLFIFIGQEGETQFNFCDGVQNLPIYSQTGLFYFILVWFSGYSRGQFIGKVFSSECGLYYVELLSDERIHKPDITIDLKSPSACHSFVCAPPTNNIQSTCSLKLDYGSVGTVSIKTKYHQTLGKCDPIESKTVSKRQLEYSLNVSYSDNWPFGSPINAHTHHNSSEANEHNFDYVHYVKLSLHLLCNEIEPRQQSSVNIMISKCTKHRNQQYTEFVVQSIPALTESCLQYVYEFTPEDKHINKDGNYHDFIYKDSGQINRGRDISIKYVTCPSECRNYKFALIVKEVDKTSIIERIVDVGHTVSTGFYHRGFRITILPPERLCARNSECKLSLSVAKPLFEIGTNLEDGAMLDSIEFRFHRKK